ncbi:MAG: hypothetical protein CMG39_00115 [Candidatus Marinimicrobia bacterium]|mgnify:FL=1|nr:hypothetical protein [Candidatus Neomarinimicrobiota bacterium]|tara:strand:+ start:2405 stop:3511 length:1107 start_codon:yes stop_codon:yes gene_type:complete
MSFDKKSLVLFMPSIEGGGVEKNLFLVANHLAKKIKKIKLITYEKTFKYFLNKNVEVLYFKRKSSNESKYFKYAMCIWLLIKFYFKNKNILVFSFQANIYCLILSKIFNFDVIIRSNSSPTGWSQGFFKNIVFKIFFKFAKSIIVNSFEFKKLLDKKFNINSTVIYNPLNKEEVIKKSKEQIGKKFFNGKSNINFINIARFTDQKDQLTMLNALNNLKNKINFELLIMGYGVNKNILQNFIKKNNLKKKIKIIGFQKNPYKFLSKADILISSSIYEGLPNVLIESLALKKFVISSDCPTGPREILKNGKYGYLFKTKSVEDLSKKILKFVKTSNKSKNLIKNKAYDSLSRFDFKKNSDKYFKLISKHL